MPTGTPIRRSSYRYGGASGIIAAATTGEVFQFTNPSTTKKCHIRRVNISAVVSTTFFAAGVPLEFDLIKATGFTALGTGGTAITPAALLKTDASESAAATPKIATTAALGAGTKTLESLSLAAVVAPGPITASLNGLILPATDLFIANEASGEKPIVLGQDEGFVIKVMTMPGTGTWTMGYNIVWDEVVNI